MKKIRARSFPKTETKVAILVVIVLVMLACSTLKPSPTKLPNYGVFIKDDSSIIEIQKITGMPNETDIRDQLAVVSSTPEFLIWYPQISLQYFLLVTLDKPGRGIPYKATPSNSNNDVLEIKLENPLNDGVYCFYQGDPLASPYVLPFWCFLVQDDTTGANPLQGDPSDQSNTGYDQEAIAFREKALAKLDQYNSVTSIIRGNHINSGPWEGVSEQTRNASHTIWNYKSGKMEEVILVDSNYCRRTNTSAWECSKDSGTLDVFSAIENILKGYIPFPDPSLTLLDSGSKMSSYELKECRMFYVTVGWKNTLDKEIHQLCFDTKSYLLVYWHFQQEINEKPDETYTNDSLDFVFGTPVNIKLPQP